MNKLELAYRESSALNKAKLLIKNGRQMILNLSEFYKSLDEILSGIEKLENTTGRVMTFFTSQELAKSLRSNNAPELETLLLKYGAKKYINEGEARYELLDILICFNNIFQTVLKI